MQEQQGHGGDSGDEFSDSARASLNGTSKHHSVPHRPPGLTRLAEPPAIARIARPQQATLHVSQRLLFILGGVFLICTLAACLIGYTAFNVINTLSATSDASTTASDFLTRLSNHDYTNAYNDLTAPITLTISQADFVLLAQNDDRCYGPITGYKTLTGSTKSQEDTQSYMYTVTRSKSGSYQLGLVLQQDQEGKWRVGNYGRDLGPGTIQAWCK
jgi:hypothetical protein